jgi:hypothetical protein
MSILQSRRQFLVTAAAAAAVGGLSTLVPASARRALAASQAPTRLVVERRTLEVLGKPASVFGIRQPDGTHGLSSIPASGSWSTSITAPARTRRSTGTA